MPSKQSVPAQQGTITPRIVEVTAAYTMTGADTTVHANIAAGGTVTAPNPSEMQKGVIYCVRRTGSAGTVTVAFPGSTDLPGDQAITIIHGSVQFYSDGVFSYVLSALLS